MDISNVTAVVLSGGRSSRMGTNKSLLKIGDITMIEHIVSMLKGIFSKVIVVTDNPSEYSFLEGVRIERDVFDVQKSNSLVGIHTGLIKADTPYVFVCACDMPFLNLKLIEYMISTTSCEDVVVPYIDGHYQPLYAIYNKNCIPYIEDLLSQNQYRILVFYDKVQTKQIHKHEVLNFDSKLECFININTKEEYKSVLDMLQYAK